MSRVLLRLVVEFEARYARPWVADLHGWLARRVKP
jgi:hypothetical protein